MNYLSTLRSPTELQEFFRSNAEHLADAEWLAAAIKPQCRYKYSDGGLLHAQQNPEELAQWLILAASIKPTSYMEIGVFKCGTFILTDAYLRATCQDFKNSMAVEKRPVAPLFCEYAGLSATESAKIEHRQRLVDSNGILTFYRTFSRQARFEKDETFDLVMVDACHGVLSTLRDFAVAKSRKPKLIAVHDIEFCKSRTGSAWEAIKAKYPDCKTWEFIGQPIERTACFGIGVIEMR